MTPIASRTLAALAVLALPACAADVIGGVAGDSVSSAVAHLPLPAVDPVDLAEVGVPLVDIAAGAATGPRPPDLVRDALMDIASEYGPGLAGRMAASMLTGGAAGLAAIPAFATGAADAVRTLEAAAEAQRAVDEAYAASAASRAETALVPDADRPLEAAALLSLVERPSRAEATWANPATGASGRVVIGDFDDRIDGRPCRLAEREYRSGSTVRGGKGLLCRQGGTWYDLG